MSFVSLKIQCYIKYKINLPKEAASNMVMTFVCQHYDLQNTFE